MSETSTERGATASGRFGFLTFAFHLWAVVALAVSNAFIILSILAVPFALRGKVRQELRRFGRSTALLKPLGLYVLVYLISVAVSLDPSASLKEAGELYGLIGLPLALLWVRDERQVRWMLQGFVVVATASAIWGLAQFFAGYGDLGQRIRGPFSHYMTFAGVLLLADLVLLARFASRRPSLRDWRWAACAVMTAALLGSLTRTSWVALLVTLLILVLVLKPRSLLVWVPAGVVALALLVTPVRERVVSIVDLQNPSNYDRLSMLDAGLEMLGERPFFGLGPGMARDLYPIYRPLAAPRHTVPHLHNTYIQIAADTGLIGLAAYFWLIGSATLAAYRGHRECRLKTAGRREGTLLEELYLASFLALIGFSLAGLFEANWFDTEVLRPVLFFVAVPFLLRSFEAASSASVEVIEPVGQ